MDILNCLVAKLPLDDGEDGVLAMARRNFVLEDALREGRKKFDPHEHLKV